MLGDVVKIAIRREDTEQTLTVAGREAWALAALIDAGTQGCTPIDRPAPRWSHYIFLLRGRGLDIETVDERHGGAYAGSHGRYVLRTPLAVMAIERAGQKNRAA